MINNNLNSIKYNQNCNIGNESNTLQLDISIDNILKRWYSHYTFFQFEKYNILNEFEKKSENLEIIFITKFPPMIGGVASQEYWRARSLAEIGFHVRVITNSNETEEHHMASKLTSVDMKYLNCDFSETGGCLRTYFTEIGVYDGQDINDHRHIPNDSMSQSKLIGIASSIVKKYESKIVISSYLEPYASASSQISRIYKIPLYLSFAGSDIDRLSKIPELSENFSLIFSEATHIATTWDKFSRIIAMGASFYNISINPPPTILPSELFNCKKSDSLSKKIDEFIIGIYGKYSEHKCIYEIIKAIEILRNQGFNVRLKMVLGGRVDSKIIKLIEERNLSNLVQFEAPLPPWKMPQFIKSCNAICFLETDFPIKIHAPITPLETAMCGVCPIISKEMLDKLRVCNFQDGNNCIVIQDAKDVDNIVQAIKPLIENVGLVAKIGMNSADIAHLSNNYNKDIISYSNTISKLIQVYDQNKFYKTKSINMTYMYLYIYYPITLQLLNNRDDELYLNLINSINIDNYLDFTLMFGKKLKIYIENKYIDDIFLIDSINFEFLRALCMISEENNFLTGNSYDVRRVNCFNIIKDIPFKLYVPIFLRKFFLIRIHTNIDSVYFSLHKREFNLMKLPARNAIIFCSTNRDPILINLTEIISHILDNIDGNKNVESVIGSHIEFNKGIEILNELKDLRLIEFTTNL